MWPGVVPRGRMSGITVHDAGRSEGDVQPMDPVGIARGPGDWTVWARVGGIVGEVCCLAVAAARCNISDYPSTGHHERDACGQPVLDKPASMRPQTPSDDSLEETYSEGDRVASPPVWLPGVERRTEGGFPLPSGEKAALTEPELEEKFRELNQAEVSLRTAKAAGRGREVQQGVRHAIELACRLGASMHHLTAKDRGRPGPKAAKVLEVLRALQADVSQQLADARARGAVPVGSPLPSFIAVRLELEEVVVRPSSGGFPPGTVLPQSSVRVAGGVLVVRSVLLQFFCEEQCDCDVGDELFGELDS